MANKRPADKSPITQQPAKVAKVEDDVPFVTQVAMELHNMLPKAERAPFVKEKMVNGIKIKFRINLSFYGTTVVRLSVPQENWLSLGFVEGGESPRVGNYVFLVPENTPDSIRVVKGEPGPYLFENKPIPIGWDMIGNPMISNRLRLVLPKYINSALFDALDSNVCQLVGKLPPFVGPFSNPRAMWPKTIEVSKFGGTICVEVKATFEWPDKAENCYVEISWSVNADRAIASVEGKTKKQLISVLPRRDWPVSPVSDVASFKKALIKKIRQFVATENEGSKCTICIPVPLKRRYQRLQLEGNRRSILLMPGVQEELPMKVKVTFYGVDTTEDGYRDVWLRDVWLKAQHYGKPMKRVPECEDIPMLTLQSKFWIMEMDHGDVPLTSEQLWDTVWTRRGVTEARISVRISVDTH